MVRNDTVLLSLNQLTNWGFFTTDTDLKVTGWSGWLETNSGHSAVNVINRNLLEVFPELVKRRLHLSYQQALEGRVVFLAQQLHKYLLPMTPSIDGTSLSHMQQSVRLAPLIEDDVIVGTLTVIEDVTERVVSEADLAAQARQQAAVGTLGQLGLAGGDLKTFMDRTSGIIAGTLTAEFSVVLQLSPDGRHTLLRAAHGWKEEQADSAAAEALSHFETASIPGSREPVIIRGDSRSSGNFFKVQGIVSGLVLPIFVGDSRLGLVGAYSQTPRNFTADNVNFLRSVGTVLGLTMERNRLETELRTRADELAEGNRRKDEFLAMLAHELRNPLAPIRNALHLIPLLGPEPRQEVGHAYGIIERQVENLVRLVDDLLDVSRITSGKVQLQKERVNLASIVARAVEGSRPLIDARRHTLELNMSEETIWLDADPLRLAQVLWNLLNNAAKYTPEGGRITLTVKRHDGVEIRIRDTGMGIPREMLPRVFDLFTQMERTLDRAEGGLGVGLTLVRRLTELHGGTVQVFSKGSGQGTEFVVRLPVASHDVAPAEPEKRRNAPVFGRRILVVDDNRDSAESLAMLLTFFGNDVRTTCDGRLALDLAAAYGPDIVLLDIGLPGLDGLEVCRRLRAQHFDKQPLIVAMTGYGQEEDRILSEQAGFNAHMVKPVDLQALQELFSRPDLAFWEGGAGEQSLTS